MIRHWSKIGYFLLGGFVATLGFIAGNMNNSVAQQTKDMGTYRQLHVLESIIVGDFQAGAKGIVGIMATDEYASIDLYYGDQVTKDPSKFISNVSLMAGASKKTKTPLATVILEDSLGRKSQLTSND